MNRLLPAVLLTISVSACSTSTMEVINKPSNKPQISKTLMDNNQKGLKRKVAIARFSNETKHGTSFLLDNQYDRLGKQAMDILSARLTDSGLFILFERADLEKIEMEQDLSQIKNTVTGVDYLILGSISAFGRNAVSEVGFFSRNKKQQANATVNVRLVDVKSGQVVFSQEGSGTSQTESNRVMGVGDTTGYDSSLDDKAISAAISKLVSNLIENLTDKPWSAYILDQQNGQIIISGGKSQGIKVNDIFKVMYRGRTVKNPQTGMDLELPGSLAAKIKVLSFAGSGDNEVSICSLSEGSLAGLNIEDLVVRDQ